MLLAFDTSSAVPSVAVADGTQVLAARDAEGSRAEHISSLIHQVLNAAESHITQVTEIAVGIGPGPFTGLRVGVMTALALSEALAAPTRGYCSLDIIAAEVDREKFLVMTDARRKEVYWAYYESRTRIAGPDVGPAKDVAAKFPNTVAIGRGATVYANDVAYLAGPQYPQAATLARLAAAGATQTFAVEPMYLRRPDVNIAQAAKQA